MTSPGEQEPRAGLTEPSARPWGREGSSEIFPALGLVAVGAYLLIEARSIAIPAGEQSIGPRFFPYLVGGAMVAIGLWLVVAVAMGDRGKSEEGEDVDTDAATDWKALATISAALVGYVLILEPVGYLLSTMGLFAAMAWTLGARRPRSLVLASVLVPFVAYMLFTRGLGVYLPNGILQAVI